MIGLSNQFNNVLKAEELLRTWQYQVEFSGGEALQGSKLDDISQRQPIYVRATSLPGREAQTLELPIAGTKFKYPGPPAYNDSWTVKFLDNINLAVRRAIDEIMGQIAVYDSSVFQKDMNVILKPINGDTQIYLERAYISNLGEAILDYGVDDIATFDATFSFHRWKFK